MKKNLLSLLLIVAMVLALFAGCGGETAASEAPAESVAAESTAAEAPAQEETPVEEEAAPAPEASAAEEAVPQEEGRVAPEVSYPLVDEPTTLTYWQAWPPFLNEISEPKDAAMFAKMEEVTGIKLDIQAVSTETSADDFMLRCASMDLTDMIQNAASSYTGGGAKAIEDEIIIDLLEPITEYSVHYYDIMMSDVNIYKNLLNDEGQIPQFIGMYTDYYYTDQGFWVRKDILDAVGKEVPTTVAEFDDVLKAFKEHGLTDPLVVLSGGTCDLLARAYGAADKLVDGEVQFAALSDNTKDYLKKLNEYYNLGYINKDFVTYTESDTKPPQDVIYSDNGGFFNEDVASIAGYYSTTTNPDFELAPVGQIRMNEGDVLDTGYIGVKAADKYSLSISTQCERVDLAVQYMDYLFSDEGFVMANYGIEGETYTVENGEYVFTDLILNNPQGFDWQLCQSLYINPGFPALTDLGVQEMTYNDAQKAAVDTWVGAYDSSDCTMPNNNWLSYTTDESETRAEIETDITTYQEEMMLKFVTGQADIDAEWETYCNTLLDMGIETLWEIQQAAVDRYMAK